MIVVIPDCPCSTNDNGLEIFMDLTIHSLICFGPPIIKGKIFWLQQQQQHSLLS
jgi:hypothetical protein